MTETRDRQPQFKVTRRIFLAGGLWAAGSVFVGNINPERVLAASKKPSFDADALRKAVKCDISLSSDKDFKDKVFSGLWNKYHATRLPEVAVRVKTDADVIAAVKFAKANNMKVAVRGGGHNWAATSLRNGGMMIDLTEMNQVLSVDPVKKIAISQPIVSNREIQQKLKPYNLAFPSGHCPQVKLSGYLLSGGMSWNQGTWGHGCESVEKIEMVTADGELITADKDHNQDYFWAARGAGPGLFAICLRYHLKLYDIPKAFTCSSYYYPMDQAKVVAEWIKETAPKLKPCVELSLWMVTAPPELAEKAKADGGKVCQVTGTAFTDSQEQGKEVMALLDTCPVMNKCLSKSINQPADFEGLFDFSGALWPENMRNQVEAMFSNSNPADIFVATADHFKKCPSPATVFMFAVFTGPNVPTKPPADTSFSMAGKLYGGPWTMWKDEKDDAVNLKWHKDMLTIIKPFTAGHYVGETDTVQYADHAVAAFTRENWKKLAELRKKYDPTGLFFDFKNGFS
ncbi:FAD-binding oxidoreductase [soil metagenome]